MPKFYSVRRPSPGCMPVGMYTENDGLWNAPGYTCGDNHPAPWKDSGLAWYSIEYELGVPHDKLYFGFGCLTQLKSWLYRDEWHAYLSEVGFVIMVWDLPDVGSTGAPCMKVGNAQAVATREALTAGSPSYLSLLNLESMDLDF